ncbi:MAG: hypothetical protein QXE81_03385 [Desulfurococcaceae archaeon]
MRLFKRKRSTAEIKNEIIRLIDKNQQVIYKVAFYSDPEVNQLLDKLIERWERNNRVNEPIDYATEDEVELLYDKALKISRKTPEELLIEYRDYLIPGY